MKIIRLSESDLEQLIKNIVSEQIPGMASNNISAKEQRDSKLASNTANILPCVPLAFKIPVQTLIKGNYNKLILKTALGVIGRESDFGESNRYKFTSALKFLAASLGIQTSVGPAQIKPETAKQFGVSVEDLGMASGSLKTAYNVLLKNYNRAIQVGYTTQPSSNFKDGTGNAALDIAIAAYNLGYGYITKFCKTNDPNIARRCTKSNTPTSDGLQVTNQHIPNYLPNFKSKRWDGVNISTHGYVKEVASRIKGYTCF